MSLFKDDKIVFFEVMKIKSILYKFGLSLHFFLASYASPLFAEDLESKTLTIAPPVTIAVRKFKNLAGDFAENGYIEGVDGEKIRVGFWKPSFEVRLAEVLTNELSNSGHFTVLERSKLYGFAEQSSPDVKKKLTPAKYIVYASLSDYIPNTAGTRKNSDGRVLIFRTGRDRKQVDTYVAVDLRVINTTTGTIAFSRTIEGTTSSVSKTDRSGLALGLIDTTSEKKSYETTSATRALRGALIKVVEYLDCHLYLKDECINEFEAEDLRRKESTKDTLTLF